MEKHLYTVQVAWSTDRKGVLCSPELMTAERRNCIEVATPPEFPKGVPGIWSPEHLFTAAIASCLMTTFLAIAENSKLEFLHFDCTSDGVLDEVDGKPALTEVILRPVVTIADEKYRERALRVLQKAESACLVSHAVKIRIATIPGVIVE
jgi:organic hydroperoxide reductase OsmC/OhrA